MQIKFANSLQSHIADLMWDAKDLEMVKKIIAVYGKEYVGVVNVLVYRGEVYGVYERYDDAYEAGIKQFGRSAMSLLEVHITRQQIQ